MTGGEKQVVSQLNNTLKDKPSYYIEPLLEVCMKSGYMYDNGTIKALSEKITNFTFLEKPTDNTTNK